MNIQDFLDSTYLKTSQQAGISLEETRKIVKNLTDEAIENHVFSVMIRPDFVKETKQYIKEKQSNVLVGTVIGFPEGTFSIEEKLKEAQLAIDHGADELDFVINYEAYKKGDEDLVKKEFLTCTLFCLQQGKVIKWIIEIAALNNNQIHDLTSKMATWANENFKKEEFKNIFVKSSTGFYKTQDGKPNGATFEGIRIMLDAAQSLPVKAAGGVRDKKTAEKMIALGVKRIGTSSTKEILELI